MSLPSMDSLRPAPPTIPLRLESEPSGAQATTSAGPSCRTPCEVAVPADRDISVTFTLDKFQPQTINVARVDLPPESSGGVDGPPRAGLDPNPVLATLEPAAPVKRTRAGQRKPAPAAAAPRTAPRRAAPPAAAAPADDEQPSPFPPPPR